MIDFTVFVVVIQPQPDNIKNRMLDHFMNEIIDMILQFCHFFICPKMLVILIYSSKWVPKNIYNWGNNKEWAW